MIGSLAGALVIRADAGPRIGAGHVMRCLALAQGWIDRGGRATLVAAELGDALAARLARDGVDVGRIAAQPGSAADVAATVAAAQEQGASWVVLDGYGFTAEYQQALRDGLQGGRGARLLALDDDGRAGRYVADLILNQNAGAGVELYADRAPHTELLLGSRYVLLRRELRRRDRRRTTPDVARRLLVTAGGADPCGLTKRTVAALASLPDLGTDFAVTVVAGHLATDDPELRAAASARPGVRLLSGVDDVAALMAASDLAVAAAGSTAWELAYMGVPAALVAVADNQRPVVAALAACGAARDLGPPESLTEEALAAAVRDLAADAGARAAMTVAGQRLVDGEGVERVLCRLLDEPLRLRPVTAADARLLWEWANDPTTRAHAFSTAPIPWDDHVAWLDRRLASADTVHYLALDRDDAPVGQVRFDLIPTAPAEAVLSVSIDRARRGAGLGAPLLRLAVARLFRDTAVATVHADVKPDNVASRRTFEKAAFICLGCHEVKGREVKGQQALHYVLHRTR